MLRITAYTDDQKTVLQLDGQFLDPWLEEVRTAYESACNSGPVSFDLANLRFACPAGTALLRRYIDDGAPVAACSNFVAQLLHLETL